MSDKRKISTRETCVFADEDLEELDEASLTTVLRDNTASTEPPEDDPEEGRGPDRESNEDQGIDDDSLGYLIPDD